MAYDGGFPGTYHEEENFPARRIRIGIPIDSREDTPLIRIADPEDVRHFLKKQDSSFFNHIVNEIRIYGNAYLTGSTVNNLVWLGKPKEYNDIDVVAIPRPNKKEELVKRLRERNWEYQTSGVVISITQNLEDVGLDGDSSRWTLTTNLGEKRGETISPIDLLVTTPAHYVAAHHKMIDFFIPTC